MKTSIKYLLIGFGMGVAFTLIISTIIDSDLNIPFYNRYEIKVVNSVAYKFDRFTGKTWQKHFKDHTWREIEHK